MELSTVAFASMWCRPSLPQRLSRFSRLRLSSNSSLTSPCSLSTRRRVRCLVTTPSAVNDSAKTFMIDDASGMFAEGSSFDALGVSAESVDALKAQGIVTPTRVQATVVPLVLKGLEVQVAYARLVRQADEAEAEAAAAEKPGVWGEAEGHEEEGMSEKAERRSTEPTVVKRPVPPADDENDVLMVGAETGSGKTLSFLLPYVEAVRKAEDVALKAVILVPSRELCWQVSSFLTSYFPTAPMHIVLAGGQPPDVSDVKSVRVVIATPAALLNHFRFSQKVDTSDKLIVVDEADMLLSGSFLRDMERILDQPGMKPFATRKNGALRAANRNRLLFVGATYPHWTGEKVRSIVTWMRRRYPTIRAVQTEDIHKKSTRVQSRWRYLETEAERLDALVDVLQEAGRGDKVMVFGSSAETVQRTCAVTSARLGTRVEEFGEVVELHKLVPAAQRKENLAKFRAGDARLLFCTDLGSRGLDLGNVTRVVEFEFSTNVVGYLHRIGRTARAGAGGWTDHFYDALGRPLADAIRERGESKTAVVDGVFSKKRSFRRKRRKGEQEAAQGLEDVAIDEVDEEEAQRLRT